MDTIESALEAKQGLDNKVLLEDGSRMNIYYSNLDHVNFVNSNTGGVDYEKVKSKFSNLKSMI